MGSNSLYSSNFGPAAAGGTVGGCILFIIGVFIAVFVLRYSPFDYVLFNLKITKILLLCQYRYLLIEKFISIKF